MTFTAALCIKPFSSGHLRRQHDDPSSPKVGCMGQVRRSKSASNTKAPRLAPLPHPANSGSRRFYFLMASVATVVSRKRRPAVMGRKVVSVEEIEPPLVVEVEKMDPPLPVAAAKEKEKEKEMTMEAISLWKRRCRSRKLEELFFCRQEKLPAAVASGGLVV